VKARGRSVSYRSSPWAATAAARDEVAGIYTAGRWAKFGKSYRQLPWEGHFSDYKERGGMLVPTWGEVGWYARDVWQAVWKGEVVDRELY
jgi:hypothetical protein